MSPGTKKKKLQSKSQLGERSVREQRRGSVEEGRGRYEGIYISRYEFLWFVVAYFLGSE